MTKSAPAALQEFITELTGFALKAEEVFERIRAEPTKSQKEFAQFAEWMIAIRGTAQQLGFPQVAKIAGIGEELAAKAQDSPSRSQVRRCVGTLWDAVTTVKYLIENPLQECTEEQEILINRLDKTLSSMGGARPVFSNDEIEKLLS
jgi:hypothetical protein